MKYMAVIDADEKPVCCEFIGCNGNVAPYLIGSTTDIKSLEEDKPYIKGDYYDGFKNGLRTRKWRYDKMKAKIEQVRQAYEASMDYGDAYREQELSWVLELIDKYIG